MQFSWNVAFYFDLLYNQNVTIVSMDLCSTTTSAISIGILGCLGTFLTSVGRRAVYEGPAKIEKKLRTKHALQVP